ncbi:aromatic amino acid transport protein [Pseudomonas aeruginosa]|nr:aromatic amino acid transport protein [Pseudomonas aeruginosa]
MDGQHPHSGELKRGLKNRHIQLIALGGAIGTGLFLGSAGVLKSAGPSMILGYAIAGFIAFMIMRQLGEMIVEEPVAGSFSHFAHKYWGGFAGFLSGWNCWVLYILVGMSELTAVGKYIHYWWPEVPTWATAALFFVVVNAINLANVKAFGEAEFWFAIIKVVAIIGMILLGCYLLFSGSGGPQASVSNLWATRRFLPQRSERPGDGHGDHHVLLRWPGNARLHRGRGGQAEDGDPEGDQPGDLSHPDLLHRRPGRAALADALGTACCRPSTLPAMPTAAARSCRYSR